LGVGPHTGEARVRRHPAEQWLVQAGLDGVKPSEFLAVMGLLLVVGTGLTFAVFGAFLPALAVGAFAATYPGASYRSRRRQRRRRGAGATSSAGWRPWSRTAWPTSTAARTPPPSRRG